MKVRKTKKLRVVIIAIFLVIGVCGLVLLNGNTEIELSKFTAQGAKALGDSGEVVIGSWSMSASGGGNVRATLYEDGRLVISGTGTMKSFANASQIDGTWHGLTESSNITSIEIKEGIWNIGPHAFKGCDYVTSVEMSDDITEIGYFAFSECSSLKEIVIPESVIEIGTSAFSGCSSLTEINIPEAVTELESNVFSGCSSLEKIDISSTVTNIKTKAFSGCSSLKAINVDNNNNIYSSENGILFNKDKSTLILYPLGKDDTTNYLIPNTVTSINEYAFEGCNKLTSVEIPSSVTAIGDFAFYKFSGLKEIKIPNTILDIGEYVFWECINLENITIPNSVENIGMNTFVKCSSLKTVVLPNNLKLIDCLFSECTSLENVIIPDSVTEIDSYAFAKCPNLKELEIPDSVTKIGTNSFYNSKITINVNSLEVMPKLLQRTQDENDILYTKEELELTDCIWNNNKDALIINGTKASAKVKEGALKDLTIEMNVNEGVDTTKPTINLVTGNAAEWTNESVTLTISATDNESGIAGYSFDDGENWQTTNSKTYTANTSDIKIKVKDNAGNITLYAQTINIDKIDTTDATISSVSGNATAWTNGNVTLTINATDSESGIAEYSFDDGENWQTTNSKRYTANTSDIKIKVKDNAGNITPYGETIKIDKIDTTNATINSVSGNSTAWTNENVILTINATDNESGIAEYSFDDGENWQTTNSKRYTANTSDIKIKVKDNAGNITPYGETIKIDKIDTTNATINSVTGNATAWTNGNVTLTISATDNESGIAEYSFDDGENWQTTNSKAYTGNANEIKIKVKDNAGNITPYGETIKIDKIDKTAPTITITPNGSNTSQSKEVIINVVDLGGSGLSNENSYQYQLGTSSTEVPTGTWQDYTKGTGFTIGEGLTGDYYIWVKNISDNAGNEAAESDYIVSNKFMFDNSEEADTIAPELSVEYSTTQLTKESVTVTIKSNEEIQEVDGWTISEDDKTLTKVYTKNATENIDVYDIVGNKATIQVKIENIDTSAPELSVEYSTTQLTNKSVTVTIKSNEGIQDVNGWKLGEDGKTLSKTYATNSTTNVDVYDIVGNKATIQVKVENIDTTNPKLSVEYDITQPTNKSVTATITANEQVQQLEGWTISEEGKTLTKIYTENTDKNIDIYDLAGNKSTAQVKITNIDKTEIEAIVEYSTTILTNKNVTVKIISNKEIKEVDGWTLLEDKKTLTKEYAENSNKDVILQDLVGNEREIKISVQNIDKIAPKVDVEYSTLKQINKSITVTIAANEDLKSLEGWTLEEDGKTLTKIYSKNITENIDVYDLAGNKVTAKITISNIDTTLPNIEVKYSTTENTKEDVVVTIVSDKQLQKIDGWTISEDGKTLTKKYEKNTVESVKVYDLAGNEIRVDVSVKNIDKTNRQETEEKDKEESKDQTTAPSIIPNAGSKTLIGVIIITIIVSIVLWTKNRKFKDIK